MKEDSAVMFSVTKIAHKCKDFVKITGISLKEQLTLKIFIRSYRENCIKMQRFVWNPYKNDTKDVDSRDVITKTIRRWKDSCDNNARTE